MSIKILFLINRSEVLSFICFIVFDNVHASDELILLVSIPKASRLFSELTLQQCVIMTSVADKVFGGKSHVLFLLLCNANPEPATAFMHVSLQTNSVVDRLTSAADNRHCATVSLLL